MSQAVRMIQNHYLGFVGLSRGFSSQAAGHAVDLTLATWHAIEDVDVEVLLDDVPDLVVLALLEVALQQLVGIARDAQHEATCAEIQQRLVPLHVLFLGEAREHTQIVQVVALLVTAEPEMKSRNRTREFIKSVDYWMLHRQ